MPDTRQPSTDDRRADSLRLCPDCGGILDTSQPTWTAAVDLVAGSVQPTAEPEAWQCRICGYRN
jgi:rubredoxin